jgi:hypothetical protein
MNKKGSGLDCHSKVRVTRIASISCAHLLQQPVSTFLRAGRESQDSPQTADRRQATRNVASLSLI